MSKFFGSFSIVLYCWQQCYQYVESKSGVNDGLVSYSVVQGDIRGDINFADDTYNGTIDEKGVLSGGLGQLTDNEYGHSNFRIDLHGKKKKGYEWIGWRSDTRLKDMPIEIFFEFDNIRNFTSVKLHCNNMFSKEVRVFKRAELYFSVGGEYYVSKPVAFDHLRDSIVDFARSVIIPIPQAVGRYVRLVLHFDAKWMLISEISFQSELVHGSVAVEEAPVDLNSESMSDSTTLATSHSSASIFNVLLSYLMFLSGSQIQPNCTATNTKQAANF